MYIDIPTHSTGNRSEGSQPLDVVGVAATESITLRILSPLKDKLLPLVGGVLPANPAAENDSFVNIQIQNSFEGDSLSEYTCTHAPLSTLRERTVSKPNSITLQHSEVNSWRRPWKHSSSKTIIWGKNKMFKAVCVCTRARQQGEHKFHSQVLNVNCSAVEINTLFV